MRRLSRGAHGLSSRIGAVSESFFSPVHSLELTVPATTSNLGPGFDCFGMALNMHCKILVSRADSFALHLHGEGSETLDRSEDNILVRATRKALQLMGKEMPPLRFEIRNAVPPQRGLGSSSSAIVAGFAAGLALGGKELYTPATKQLLLNLAAAEESDAKRMRHARIAPAVYGGLQISFKREDGVVARHSSAPDTTVPWGQEPWVAQRVAVPRGLQCVLFIPDEQTSTAGVRDVLPATVSYADTVFNVARAAMLTNCFATAQFDPLRFAMQDKLHQQYRAKLFPFTQPIVDAALKAGAHGVFISGAGPTVVAITGGVGKGGRGAAEVGADTMSQFLAEAVSLSMHEAATAQGVAGSVHIAEPSIGGLTSAGYDKEGNQLWSHEDHAPRHAPR